MLRRSLFPGYLFNADTRNFVTPSSRNAPQRSHSYMTKGKRIIRVGDHVQQGEHRRREVVVLAREKPAFRCGGQSDNAKRIDYGDNSRIRPDEDRA